MPNRSFNRAGTPASGGTLHAEQSATASKRATAVVTAPGGMDTCCLLVMEAGSRWPTWLEAPPEGRVVAQDAGESPTDFASRVVQAMRKVRASGQELDTVAISAGWVEDEEQVLFARSLITQAAARAMGDRGGAIILSGHDRLPEEVRHELFATAGVLAQLLAGTSIEVLVRLDPARQGPRATSGVFPPPEAPLDLEDDCKTLEALPAAAGRPARTGSDTLILS